MIDPESWEMAPPPADAPVLVVVVDTEEEFDWQRPLARENVGVGAMRAQPRAHRVFEKYGIRPTYVVDYPVASQPDGAAPLRELLADGRCDIGAHLHPWVNPPHEETVGNFNSYPGNLPPALERAKLARLSAAIEQAFGKRPTVYKAGRYGAGPATTETLEALGFQVDTSVLPDTDLSPDEGPDYSHCGAAPYWFGRERRLLEIPMTVGYAGSLRRLGRRLHDRLTGAAGRRLHLPGLFARVRLLDRITLTPEGITPQEHRRLTGALLAAGHRVFSFTYHSPSLAPGNTPYVRSEAELGRSLDSFERYFDYFLGTLGGRTMTAQEVHDALAPRRAVKPPTAPAAPSRPVSHQAP